MDKELKTVIDAMTNRLHRADLALNVLEQIAEMMDSVIESAQQEFVKVPYGASHEDVAAINDWHQRANECRRAYATYKGA